jgi:hypothetical protein
MARLRRAKCFSDALYQIPMMRARIPPCHCEEQSDEAISAAYCIRREIASLCSQWRLFLWVLIRVWNYAHGAKEALTALVRRQA